MYIVRKQYARLEGSVQSFQDASSPLVRRAGTLVFERFAQMCAKFEPITSSLPVLPKSQSWGILRCSSVRTHKINRSNKSK
jgi:hypothetical protein